MKCLQIFKLYNFCAVEIKSMCALTSRHSVCLVLLSIERRAEMCWSKIAAHVHPRSTNLAAAFVPTVRQLAAVVFLVYVSRFSPTLWRSEILLC